MSDNKNILHDWANTTTWHGVRDMFHSTHIISKIVWIVILIVTSVMCGLNIYTHVNDFIAGETWITDTYHSRPKNGVRFPNITICNFNRASKVKLEKLNMSLNVAAYILDSLQEPFGGLETYDPVMNHELEMDYLEYARTRGNWPITDWLRGISPECEDVLDACFLGLIPLGSFNCCANVKYMDVYGKGRCMIIRPPEHLFEIFPQRSAGPRLGLHLFLNPRLEDYAPVYASSMAPSAGFLISAGSDPVYYSQYTTPVAIMPGSHTWIGMSLEEHKLTRRSRVIPLIYPLYIPDLPCVVDNKLVNIEGLYAFEMCVSDCMLQLSIDNCGCAPPEVVKAHVKLCDPVSWHQCRPNIPALNFSNPTWISFMQCIASCGRPCTRRKVLLTSSVTTFPNPGQAEAFKKFVQQMRVVGSWPSNKGINEISVVDMFFQSTRIKIIDKHERITIETLISNIGGSLGIWAGMSVVTVYQAFLYLFRGFWRNAKCSSKIYVGTMADMENGTIPNGYIASDTNYETNFPREGLYSIKPYFTFSEFEVSTNGEQKKSFSNRAAYTVKQFFKKD